VEKIRRDLGGFQWPAFVTARRRNRSPEIEALGARRAWADVGFAGRALTADITKALQIRHCEPALHSRTDLISASQEDYLSYREVNAFMARALLRFKKPDTVFWVQDYHFLARGGGAARSRRHPADRGSSCTHHAGGVRSWKEFLTNGELVEAMLAYDIDRNSRPRTTMRIILGISFSGPWVLYAIERTGW